MDELDRRHRAFQGRAVRSASTRYLRHAIRACAPQPFKRRMVDQAPVQFDLGRNVHEFFKVDGLDDIRIGVEPIGGLHVCILIRRGQHDDRHVLADRVVCSRRSTSRPPTRGSLRSSRITSGSTSRLQRAACRAPPGHRARDLDQIKACGAEGAQGSGRGRPGCPRPAISAGC